MPRSKPDQAMHPADKQDTPCKVQWCCWQQATVDVWHPLLPPTAESILQEFHKDTPKSSLQGHDRWLLNGIILYCNVLS